MGSKRRQNNNFKPNRALFNDAVILFNRLITLKTNTLHVNVEQSHTVMITDDTLSLGWSFRKSFLKAKSAV